MLCLNGEIDHNSFFFSLICLKVFVITIRMGQLSIDGNFMKILNSFYTMRKG